MAEERGELLDKIQKYTTKGDWSKALNELHKLNDLLKGKDLRIRMKIAEALAKLDKKEEAIKEYLAVADGYAADGLIVQAIAVNKLIVKLDPSRTDVHQKLAKLQGGKEVGSDISMKRPEVPVREEPSKETKTEGPRQTTPSVPRTPLFSDLATEELSYLAQKVNVKEVAAGSTIFNEGDPGESIFIITHGEVSILDRNQRGEEVEFFRLKTGDFFGEFAFFANLKRQGCAKAVVDTEMLEITKDILGDLSARHPRVKEVIIKFYKQRVVEKLLATSILFCDLPGAERQEILQKLTYHAFGPGALIVTEGSQGDYLYLVKSGHADIITWRNEQEITLATIGEGEFFGEISLVTGSPRTASVKAKTQMETLRLSKQDFDVILGKYSSVRKVVEDIIKKRVEDTLRVVLDKKKLCEKGLV